MYFVLSSIFQSHCSWRNLHRWQKFYTAAGSDGIDKCHLWLVPTSSFGILIVIRNKNGYFSVRMKIEGNSTNWAVIWEIKMVRIHSENSCWPYPPKPHQGGRQAVGMGCHIKVTVKSPTARHTLIIVLWCVKKVVWKHMGKSGYGQANYRNIQNFNQPPMHAARQQDAEYSAVNLVGSSIDVYHCQSAAIQY